MAKPSSKSDPEDPPGPAEVTRPGRADAEVAPRDILIVQAGSSSPLPPPALLRQYNAVSPGAAERMLTLLEAQTRHRHQLETRVVTSDILRAYSGILSALLVSLTSIVAGSYVAVNGQPWAGTAIATTTVVGLVYTFLRGVGCRRDERAVKSGRPRPPEPPLTPP